MARNSKSTATESKAPDFIAWHVAENGEKAFWSLALGWRASVGRARTG